MIDKRAEDIIESIDGARLISKYKISSSFNDVALDIDKLSAGCKTVLNVMYNPDKVFCMKVCWMMIQENIFHWMTKISI